MDQTREDWPHKAALSGQSVDERTTLHGVTPRDHGILRLMAMYGTVSAAILKELFWPGQKNNNVYRRLRVLTEKELIAPHLGDRGQFLGYHLTPKGAALVRIEGALGTHFRIAHSSYRTAFDHDQILISLHAIFGASPIISDFRTEKEVRITLARKHGLQEKKDEKYKVPDAIFTLTTTKGIFTAAVELELAMKSKARYWRMLTQLATTHDCDVTFFVVDGEKTLAAIKETLAQVREKEVLVKNSRRQNGFYFVLLVELLKQRGDAVFHGGREPFSLNSLAKESRGVADPLARDD